MCSLTDSVLIETSYGNLLIGIYGRDCPNTARNFLQLCALKFYHGATVRRVVRNAFFEVAGHVDLLQPRPDGATATAECTAEFLLSSDNAAIPLETQHQLHGPLLAPDFKQRAAGRPVHIGKRGQVVMINNNNGNSNSNSANQHDDGTRCSFLITTTDRRLDFLDKKHVLIGEVIFGGGAAAGSAATAGYSPEKVLRKINNLALRGGETLDGAPIRAIHIRHTHVIADSSFGVVARAQEVASGFSMLEFLQKNRANSNAAAAELPIKQERRSSSPIVNMSLVEDGFSSADEDDADFDAESESLRREVEVLEAKIRKRRDDETQQIMMQLIGERPAGNSDAKPPDNVLFVCKLNPLTLDEDLAQCFEQFGRVVSCDIIKDKKTGASLRYGFIEFETAEQCSQAFKKMDKVKIDDSRIHVDFSQSMGPAYWAAQRDKQASAAAASRIRPRQQQGF